jgi:predicted ATP-dependent protease
MLRADVIDACKRGEFSIWPIETIDQGITLLTGHPVGERADDGSFPTGSVNRAVVERLQAFLKLRKEVEADEAGREKKR